MKYLLSLILAIPFQNLCGQTLLMKEGDATMDMTTVLDEAFRRKEVQTVVIQTNLLVNGKLTIPAGKTIKFDPGSRISGNGVINGGIIDAGYQYQIFDTTLTVNPESVNHYFSAKWFGANGTGKDDYSALQKAINTCLLNSIKTLYLPAGVYKISKPLILRGKAGPKGARGYCTLELLGESSFWDSNTGTELQPIFTDRFAIGIHRGKGCKVRKMRITGKFTPPNKNDEKKFFNTSFEDFTDGICRDNRLSPYAGIVIDPFTNVTDPSYDPANQYPGLSEYYGTNGTSRQSGSTAIEIEEVSINNFVVGICSAPNGITRNAELTLINKVSFSNCKLCVSGGHDQEKDNKISNISCWGGTHTVFATGLYGGVRMAGNWTIDHVNIAGNVVRFIHNEQHGYFSSNISHVYAELLGSWGTINSNLACEISNCNVDFAFRSIAGKQVLLRSWGKNIVYRSCNFRYYGEPAPMLIEGNCVFEHCYFSGPVEKNNNSSSPIFRLPFSGGATDLIPVILTLAIVTTMGIIYFLMHRRPLRFSA